MGSTHGGGSAGHGDGSAGCRASCTTTDDGSSSTASTLPLSYRNVRLKTRSDLQAHPSSTAKAQLSPKADAASPVVDAADAASPDVAAPTFDGEGFKVSIPNEIDILCWRVEMSVPEGCSLRDALQQHGERFNVRPTVELEVTFGSDFPSTPPFVRVVAPRFKFHTGHVTVGGSICMQLLTTSGWNAGYTMEAVLESVRQAFLEGGGTLDVMRAHVPYEPYEAKAAFDRVAQQHGWVP